jgi:IMP dehydrogenase/GMP reductase
MQVVGRQAGKLERFAWGGQMETRRNFLTGLAVTGGLGVMWNSLAAGQERQMPHVPKPAGQEPTADTPTIPSPEKTALETNEKDIKKKVERLYELATELKAEVDKTDSSKVLSLTLLKKAEEIEKLAKDIKTRSKG